MTAAHVDDHRPRCHERQKVKMMVVNPDVGSDEEALTRQSSDYAAQGTPTRPPPTLTPPDLGSTNPSSKLHATHKLSIAETADSPETESSPQRSSQLPSEQRMFSPARQVLSPQAQSITDRIIVAVTRDAESYVSVDLSGYTVAQAIREKILSKLYIPEDLHSTFSIYQTELHGYAIGGALDDTQLLIKCQLFGDDKSSLRFLVQRTDLVPMYAGFAGLSLPERIIIPARIRQSGKVPPKRPSGQVHQSDALHRQQQSQGLAMRRPPQPHLSQPQQHPARQKPPSRPLPSVPQYSLQGTVDRPGSQNPRSNDSQGLASMGSHRQPTPSQPSDHVLPLGQLHDSSSHQPPLQQFQEFKHPPPPPSLRQHKQDRLSSGHQGILGEQQIAGGQTTSGDGAAASGERGRATELVYKDNFEPPLSTPANGLSSNPIPPIVSGASEWVAINAPLSADSTEAPPVVDMPAVPSTGSGTGRQKKSLRMKTAERKQALERINAARTAQQANDKNVDSDSDSDSVPTTGYFTRRNAKIWGGRRKITPGGRLGAGMSSQDPGTVSDGPRQQRRMLKRAKAQLLGSADGTVQDVETDDAASNIRPIVMIESGQISCEEMFQHLIAHGCADLSSDIDPEQYSSGFVIGGAFGDIWKGKLRDGTEVAIKVWRFTSLLHNGSKAMKRAMREIYYWSKAKHEYVQELMGVIIFQGRLGMVSRWMRNGNLREYLYKNPNVDRYSLCLQVATGVAYLHGRDMVHGDLKGMNVLVSPDGVAKLSDFDHAIMSECSLAFSETSKLGGGTIRWMAPELILDEDCRRSAYTDVYALGMTMLEIITGTSPYYPQCKEDVNVIKAIMKRLLPVRPMDHLSDNLRDNRMWELLLRCWNYDPLARPKSAEVVELASRLLQQVIALPTISDPV